MRYKVGDKVRVRKDLEGDKWYGSLTFWDYMKYLKGKTVVISGIKEDENAYYLENERYYVSDEMLEPVEDIIEYKGKKYDVVGLRKADDSISPYNCAYDMEMALTEHKEEILDEAEKRYLRNVIKYVIEPTHNEILYISKGKMYRSYFILIKLKGTDEVYLPFFKDERMYKGMELDEPYSLKQLGLED